MIPHMNTDVIHLANFLATIAKATLEVGVDE
jgi:hypothetical protein